jgi:hypothetical protein
VGVNRREQGDFDHLDGGESRSGRIFVGRVTP